MNHADQVFMDAQSANQQSGSGSIPTDRLRKGEWEVRECDLKDAQRLTRKYHYSAGGSNTAVGTYGLFRRTAFMEQSRIFGATWWLPPTKTCGASVNPDNPQGVLSLSRVVCVPDAPKNSCSFLIRHSMRFIDRKRWPVLITFADGWRGHDGTIYKALASCGWVHDGYSKPERTYVKNGVMGSRKRGPKTYTHSEMLSLGYECVGKFRRKRFVHRGAGNRSDSTLTFSGARS